MRLAWLTDIHLNFLEADQRRRFLRPIGDQCDALVVSGDIGESHNVVELLVLCGHTHGAGELRVGERIRVLTGGAVYGKPQVQQIFELL